MQVVLYVPAGLVYTAVEDKVVFQSITAVPERLKLTEALALFLLPVSTLSVQFPISMFVGYAKCRPEICWFFSLYYFFFSFFIRSVASVRSAPGREWNVSSPPLFGSFPPFFRSFG